LAKNELSRILGDFFTNSSGHPGSCGTFSLQSFSGKYFDYFYVDISPANFFVPNCPPIIFVYFARQHIFV
jgi:hypothetical protein